MKKNNRYIYSEIVSFDDFQFEKEKLKFKKRLIETKIDYRFSLIKDAFSASKIISSVAKDIVWPNVLSFIGDITNKPEAESPKTAAFAKTSAAKGSRKSDA
jgi:hypothetical protein